MLYYLTINSISPQVSYIIMCTDDEESGLHKLLWLQSLNIIHILKVITATCDIYTVHTTDNCGIVNSYKYTGICMYNTA